MIQKSDFSHAEAILRTPEGKALSSSLGSIPRSVRQEIASAMQAGNTAQAIALLEPYLGNGSISDAISRLRGGEGHG